eukprot:7009641-Pyramimonas_sp.AAC.1
MRRAESWRTFCARMTSLAKSRFCRSFFLGHRIPEFRHRKIWATGSLGASVPTEDVGLPIDGDLGAPVEANDTCPGLAEMAVVVSGVAPDVAEASLPFETRRSLKAACEYRRV